MKIILGMILAVSTILVEIGCTREVYHPSVIKTTPSGSLDYATFRPGYTTYEEVPDEDVTASVINVGAFLAGAAVAGSHGGHRGGHHHGGGSYGGHHSGGSHGGH